MGTNSFLDPKYDGLSTNERIRQAERDNKLEEQNKLLAEQNKLKRQEMEIKAELQEKQRIAEIKRQIELEEQTRIEKERLFIENLNEKEKELYSTFKKALDSGNRTFSEAINLKQNYVDNKNRVVLELQNSTKQYQNASMKKYKIITSIIICIIIAYFIIRPPWFLPGIEYLLLLVFIISIFVILIVNAIYNLTHRKINEKFSMIKKDIEIMGKKFDQLGKINEPNFIEYIHILSFDGVSSYLQNIDKYCSDILKLTKEIETQENQIRDRISQVKDELSSNYKKNNQNLNM
ncbi:MAG: hypothetical protein K6B70_05150 [Clostridia bacterium]|nr:hypothetical protein [Clostridia bacterium]